MLQSHPEHWQTILRSMRMQAKHLFGQFNVIASIAVGGIVHGAVIAHSLNVPHVTVRLKEKTGHGLGGHIDGDPELLRGTVVLVIEDMSSTYKSTLEAIRILEAAGAHVMHTLAISTWGFPEFYTNVGEREACVLCTGDELIEYAHKKGIIERDYLALLHDWIEDPYDKSWIDESWIPPKE